MEERTENGVYLTQMYHTQRTDKLKGKVKFMTFIKLDNRNIFFYFPSTEGYKHEIKDEDLALK